MTLKTKKPYNLLIVEDSKDIQDLLTFVLSPIAKITTTPSVVQALDLFLNNTYDMILMDVELEDGDGFDLTSQIRKTVKGKNLPLMFLTTKSHIEDKKTGFSLGAEDYIVKPCDPIEIRMRVESRLEKISNHPVIERIEKSGLLLDVPLQKVYLAPTQQDIDVTPLQFKILYFLMSHENEIVSREKLIQEIWGQDVHIGRSIDTHINSLRRKLGDHSKKIQSVYGSGYRFNGE